MDQTRKRRWADPSECIFLAEEVDAGHQVVAERFVLPALFERGGNESTRG